MVRDAEGHTKVVTVRVTGAASDEEARQAARKVADSQLVKCSWFGADPYWGRVASDLGTAGVALDPAALTIAYGGTVVSRGCVPVDHDAGAVAAHMAGEEIDLHCDLGVGAGRARVFTNDLTYGYIDENRGTSCRARRQAPPRPARPGRWARPRRRSGWRCCSRRCPTSTAS